MLPPQQQLNVLAQCGACVGVGQPVFFTYWLLLVFFDFLVLFLSKPFSTVFCCSAPKVSYRRCCINLYVPLFIRVYNDKTWQAPQAALHTVHELVNQGWVELAKSPADAIVPIIQEFYANLRVKHESYQVFVRGKMVAFDATTINMIYNLPSFDNDEYTKYINGNIDYNTMIRDLCIEGAEWRTNHEAPATLKKSEMLRDPSSWASFILAKILPSTHQTEITKDKVALIHAIMTGKSLDLAKIIHGSIMRAGTGFNTIGLPCPHIITDLCHHAGVTWGVDEQVLKAKAPIIVFRENPGYGLRESERQHKRAAYNQCARNRRGAQPSPSNKVTLGDRITRIEQDIKAQRTELTEHRQTTNIFMTYIIDFMSVLAQRFLPTEPTDTNFLHHQLGDRNIYRNTSHNPNLWKRISMLLTTTIQVTTADAIT